MNTQFNRGWFVSFIPSTANAETYKMALGR